MASLMTVGGGTEVCAMTWTEGTEAGLELGVFMLVLADSWIHAQNVVNGVLIIIVFRAVKRKIFFG